MMNRTTMLLIAVALVGPVARCPAASVHNPAAVHLDDDDKKESDEKKSEQNIPVDGLPAAVVATVLKECPGGKITEAEKETKKGKTYYSMDVSVGETKYDVKTTPDGTFRSKKVDDDDDEKK